MKNKEIPEDIKDLVLKYRISPKKIYFILSKYGSMENFIEKYARGELDEETLKVLKDNLRFSINTDTEKKDLDELCDSVKRKDKGITIYSEHYLSLATSKIEQELKEIVAMRFGVRLERKISISAIADKFGKNTYWVNRRLDDAYKIIRTTFNNSRDRLNIDEYISDEIRDQILGSNIIFYPDQEYRNIPDDIDYKELREKIHRQRDIKLDEDEQKRKDDEQRKKEEDAAFALKTEEYGDKKIEDVLKLSKRAFNCLQKAGINTIADLISCSDEDLIRIEGLGRKTFDEIETKLKEIGLGLIDYYTDEEKKEKQELIRKILEKQRIIRKQQQEIAELENKEQKRDIDEQ